MQPGIAVVFARPRREMSALLEDLRMWAPMRMQVVCERGDGALGLIDLHKARANAGPNRSKALRRE